MNLTARMHFVRFSYILIIVAAIGHKSRMVAAAEPGCSPFDYEEKILTKMIRTEIKFEQLLDDVKKTKESMASIAEDMSKRMENAENKVVTFQGEIEETVKTMAGDLERAKEMITTAAEEAVSVHLVAFNALMSYSPNKLTASTNDIIVFDTILTNEGDGYNRATGKFTAPQSGLYHFAAHLCNEGNKNVYFAIVVEDTLIASTTRQDKNNEYSCSSVSTVAMVKSSENVWVQSTSTSYTYTDKNRWNTFTGVLLNR